MTVFEQEYRGQLWRVARMPWNGRDRLNVWPFFRVEGTGELRAGKRGSGFNVPLDRVPELITALQTVLANDAAQGNGPEGAP